MQKQVRTLKPAQRASGKDIVFGITLTKEIQTFASGIYYEAQWVDGDIILKSGTYLKPDDKEVKRYKFEDCRIEVNNEDSNSIG